MSRGSGQTAAQKELERISIERERQLRVENARQTTKAFSENIAFRKKLRGIFSLLSGGFGGFPTQLGVTPGAGGAGGVGGFGGRGSGAGGIGGGTGVPGSGGQGGPRVPRRRPPGHREPRHSRR